MCDETLWRLDTAVSQDGGWQKQSQSGGFWQDRDISLRPFFRILTMEVIKKYYVKCSFLSLPGRKPQGKLYWYTNHLLEMKLFKLQPPSIIQEYRKKRKDGKTLEESSKDCGNSAKDANSPLQPSPKTVFEVESQERDPFESVCLFLQPDDTCGQTLLK